MIDTQTAESLATPPAPATREWFARNNRLPFGATRFHVTGEVRVPNPGVDALLVARAAPDVSPKTLRLDLILEQASGAWPPVSVWAPTRYDKSPGCFERVEIHFRGEIVADVPVHDID